ncbi:MAG: FAD-binding oxidoreductase [Kibdelosporangium sp.]
MRIVIVGGGVIALLTAVNCASAGHEVVLVDQAGIPFSGATSFDRHRVLRALHLDDPAAAKAAVQAHDSWIGLQYLLSTTFYKRVGALTVVAGEHLDRAAAILDEAGSQASVLGPDELSTSYRHVGFPADASAVFESHAGILLADRVLAACAGWLRWHPSAQLHPHRKAVEVDVDNASVKLADGEVVRGDAVLAAIGPWSQDLLAPELAGELVLHRQSMLYCEVPGPAAGIWSATPAIPSLGRESGAWLVTPVAGTPLKLSAAGAERTVHEVGDNTTPQHWREYLVDTFAAIIPGFSNSWVTDTRDCYYLTRAATGGPMLAVLAGNVLSYAACGGSSFKFAPLIAQCLAERLTGADPAPTGLDALDHPIHPQAGLLTRGMS